MQNPMISEEKVIKSSHQQVAQKKCVQMWDATKRVHVAVQTSVYIIFFSELVKDLVFSAPFQCVNVLPKPHF